jgi:hypothetical protein
VLGRASGGAVSRKAHAKESARGKTAESVKSNRSTSDDTTPSAVDRSAVERQSTLERIADAAGEAERGRERATFMNTI